MTALLFNLPQIAAMFGFEQKFLKTWLRQNPFSRDRLAHYRTIGRDHIFDLHQLTLIYYQLRDTGVIAQPIDIWDGKHYEIEKAAPGAIELLHVERGTMNQEKCFHRNFAAIRAQGEWFHKVPELLAFIEQRKQIAGP